MSSVYSCAMRANGGKSARLSCVCISPNLRISEYTNFCPLFKVKMTCQCFLKLCSFISSNDDTIKYAPDIPKWLTRCVVVYSSLIKKYKYFPRDRKSTRLNSSHVAISYAVFCLKKKQDKRIMER